MASGVPQHVAAIKKELDGCEDIEDLEEIVKKFN
jgi:hypothetical protein